MKAAALDRLNIALIALSCLAAHAFPYHLLIFSYAVLGPAHYLTQISWLHDRRYFMGANISLAALLLVALSLCLTFPETIGMPTALAMGLALAVAFAAVMPARLAWRGPAAAAGVALALLLSAHPRTALFLVLLLPTVIHVFVFTACFMWAGALKSAQPGTYAPLFALLAGAATFALPAAPFAIRGNPDGLIFFRPVVAFMQSLLPFSAAGNTRLFGFLSFAYTYHYLNWFSKAEIIRWHRIPRRRLAAIVLLYGAALAVYAHDYRTGFLVLLFLAQLHVLLEFPLNLRTFALIGQSLKKRRAQ